MSERRWVSHLSGLLGQAIEECKMGIQDAEVPGPNPGSPTQMAPAQGVGSVTFSRSGPAGGSLWRGRDCRTIHLISSTTNVAATMTSVQ